MSSLRAKVESICSSAAILVFLMTVPALTQVTAEQSNGLFDFKSDVRVFTAYAMMNAAGGSGEWRRAGMHPIRSELRSDLAGKLDTVLQKELRDFNQFHGRILETYEFALLTSGPPHFRLNYDPKTTGSIAESVKSDSGLSELLAEFYKKAGIAKLWKKYRPLIQAENDKYKPFADMAVADVQSYCLLDSNYFSRSSRRIHFQYMPLLPYFASLTARVNGELYLIVGPQEEKPDKTIFYYYLLRHVVGPLVRNDSTDVNRLSGLYDVVRSKIDMRRGNWNTLVSECFAEAIDIRLEAAVYKLDSSAVDASLASEYKFGFILCPTIYDMLAKYELSGKTFTEYFPTILGSINPHDEEQRWDEFWGGK